VGANVGAVKYRLSTARSQLQRELGEGDLIYLNEPSVPMRQWAWLPLDQMFALETRRPFVERRELRVESAGKGPSAVDLSTLNPQPLTDRGALGSKATTEDTMERRDFLRQAAVGAAGLMLSETEK